MIRFHVLFIVLSFSFPYLLNAQTNRLELQKSREPVKPDTSLMGFKNPDDSLIHINLKTVEIVRPFIFKNKRQEKKYDPSLNPRSFHSHSSMKPPANRRSTDQSVRRRLKHADGCQPSIPTGPAAIAVGPPRQ